MSNIYHTEKIFFNCMYNLSVPSNIQSSGITLSFNIQIRIMSLHRGDYGGV